jgi:serine/threonine-protein kinase
MALTTEASTATPRRRIDPRDLLAPTTLVGRWQIEGELGRGGMASVHSATDVEAGQRAAIKIAQRGALGGQLTPDVFMREARIVRMIDHPAIVGISETGMHDGRPYLVMEQLFGETLGAQVEGAHRPSPTEALAILLELCDVLRAAHAAGVVHRDLKLDNVFVVRGGTRRVKLIDWGVAFVMGEPDPFDGFVAGTLTYVAPEQIRGDALGPACDIYALAVLAYHLLCARPPFTATTEGTLVRMHLRAVPPRASRYWLEAPPVLDELLFAMLAKDPAHRPTLATIERVLHASIELVSTGAPRRFPRGTTTPPPAPSPSPNTAPLHRVARCDVLGRPVLPLPSIRLTWVGLAFVLAAAAGLVSALP